MKKWRQYQGLSGYEQGLFWRSIILLPVLHSSLFFWEYPRLLHFLEKKIRLGKRIGFKKESEIIEKAFQISRIVSIAARYGFFQATCLRRSLLIWCLLRREGIRSTIEFGIKKTNADLQAHAWVQIDGVVISERDGTYQQYQPIGSTIPPTRSGL